MTRRVKTINILGATGSIGECAADVIAANLDHFDVQTVTAFENAEKLAACAVRLGARRAVIVREDKHAELARHLAGNDVEALSGVGALIKVAGQEVDVTLAAIVGIAGLSPIMAAIEGSSAVAIANKEPLVAAGALVMAHAKKHDTTLLPVDSEHNAIFQVFDVQRRQSIEKIILTASGGPFRTWSVEEMASATPEQALAHPNWMMGAKISIDSATMMNKALEIIEAHYLFDVPPDNIEVLVHPQSTVHSMVGYCDGSVLAQMGASDMRTPLANVLAWPDRLVTPGARLDISAMARLDFEAVDDVKFPAIAMAYECLSKGAYACIAMNAANEVAVEEFLARKIDFAAIIRCVRYVLDAVDSVELPTIKDIQNYDEYVRALVRGYIGDYIKDNEITEMVN